MLLVAILDRKILAALYFLSINKIINTKFLHANPLILQFLQMVEDFSWLMMFSLGRIPLELFGVIVLGVFP